MEQVDTQQQQPLTHKEIKNGHTILTNFLSKLNTTNTICRQDVISLESSLGSNIITNNRHVNYYSVTGSNLYVNEIKEIIKKELETTDHNLLIKPVDILNIVDEYYRVLEKLIMFAYPCPGPIRDKLLDDGYMQDYIEDEDGSTNLVNLKTMDIYKALRYNVNRLTDLYNSIDKEVPEFLLNDFENEHLDLYTNVFYNYILTGKDNQLTPVLVTPEVFIDLIDKMYVLRDKILKLRQDTTDKICNSKYLLSLDSTELEDLYYVYKRRLDGMVDCDLNIAVSLLCKTWIENQQ